MASRNTYATFSNGIKVPLLGLGTWKSKPGEVKNAIKTAIDAGYRHFDGAKSYENEKEVGEAYREKIADGTVKREDLFITTKLWSTYNRPERVEYCLRLSLKALQLDYVDLYLIHTPMGIQYKGDDVLLPTEENGEVPYDDISPTETWKAMEKLVEKGLAKSIGVSNFTIQQIEDVLKIAKIPIATNQVENHPCLDQKELTNFCKSKSILITSYSPFGSPDRGWASEKDPKLLEDPVVKDIARSKGCTPGQVLIAYHLCQGFLCIPKSVTPSRIQENFQSLDVKLSKDDISKLDTLACGYRACTIEFWKGHIHYPF